NCVHAKHLLIFIQVQTERTEHIFTVLNPLQTRSLFIIYRKMFHHAECIFNNLLLCSLFLSHAALISLIQYVFLRFQSKIVQNDFKPSLKIT
uniref:Uncharacterized protein n=1 Tax=Amphiprion percula TaxID=161767 RepID=A0A3P8TXT1_AMPPE